MLFISLPSWITCERLYPSIERAEPGKKMEKNRKGYDRGRKSLYINRLEAVFGGHRHRISPGNWVKRVFPGDLFPTKIATFDQRRSPPFFLHPSSFSFLSFKGEAFPFNDVNSVLETGNSKITNFRSGSRMDLESWDFREFPPKYFTNEARFWQRPYLDFCHLQWVHLSSHFFTRFRIQIKQTPCIFAYSVSLH